MPIRILMVCLGNICRSPLAQVILTSKLSDNKFIVKSAGIGSWHVGQSPDKRSVEVAKKNGLDISNQKAAHFNPSDFEVYDYIFVMDNSNYIDVIKQTNNENYKSKVNLILNELFPNENMDVPDPYYGLQNGFEEVYKLLDYSCTVLANKLMKIHT
jgi:protein-tyrosine phosphatase